MTMSEKDIRQEIWEIWEKEEGNCSGCPAHNLSYTPSYGGKEGKSIEEFEVMIVLSDPNEDRHDEPSDDGKLSGDDEEWNYGYHADNGWDMMEDYLNPIVRQITGHGDADDVYFTNAHKCPTYADDGLSEGFERDLRSLEHCQSYLEDEIEAVNPEVVVALSNESIAAVGEVMTKHEFNASKGSGRYTGATRYVEEWIRDKKRFYGLDPAVVAGVHPAKPNSGASISRHTNIELNQFGDTDTNWSESYYQELALSIDSALSGGT